MQNGGSARGRRFSMPRRLDALRGLTSYPPLVPTEATYPVGIGEGDQNVAVFRLGAVNKARFATGARKIRACQFRVGTAVTDRGVQIETLSPGPAFGVNQI